MQNLALRHIGGFPRYVDHVLVHSDWLPEQLSALEPYGIKLHAGSIPPAEQYDGSEFEAANMLKVDVVGLMNYAQVLYLDLDMLPREPSTQFLEWVYDAGLVGFPGPTTPISGQLFVVRPDEKVHRLMRRLAWTRASSFSVARGWANSGLLTWPEVHASDVRAQCNASAMRQGMHLEPQRRRRCHLDPYWVARCQRYGLTNWAFMHAGSDQGLLWYAFNLSGLSSVRTLFSKPRSSDGTPLLLGLPFWVHLQGTCKPWLVTRDTLRRSKCLKANAFFFHGIWERFRDAELERKCPSFARAFERFKSVAPTEARLPCFWGGRTNCFDQYRPAWVVD